MVMPYAGLEQPIDVHTDARARRQVVSYWGGLDVFYLDEAGPSCEVVPRAADGETAATAAVARPPWKLFHFFPDLDLFERVPGATATVRGVECAVWHRREDDYAVDGNFVGEYWYYAALATGAPARFSMLGHNVITNSHFDNYTWEYLELVDRAPDPAVFLTPAGCESAPVLADDDSTFAPERPPAPPLAGDDKTTLRGAGGLDDGDDGALRAPAAETRDEHFHDAAAMLPGRAARALREAEYGAWAAAAARGAERLRGRRRARRGRAAQFRHAPASSARRGGGAT